METKKVVIIGSGLGALSTALRLTTAGYRDITILEKYHQAGGRLNELRSEGFTFDMGPSFFSMSYEFDELFSSCRMPNPLQYRKLDPLYTVHFAGTGKRYSVTTDLQQLAREFADIEPAFLDKVEKYLQNAGAIFHDTEDIVIKSNFDSRLEYLLSLARVPWKHAPRMFRTMWADLDKSFESHEVKVILSLVAFFLGATPFDTPAVYKLLSYTELKHDGYWNIEGGMYRITEKIQEELLRRGVRFVFNTEITSVRTQGTRAVFADAEGTEYPADIYIVNSDAAAFRGQVLKRKAFSEQKLDNMEWTLSPFTIYLGVRGKISQLAHHNYFLGDNFRDYADKIFKMSVNPEKPYYYVNVSSRSNPGTAPEGCENLFILCPVPDLRYKPDWSDAEQLADTIISDLSERVNFDIKPNLLTRTVLTPADWQQRFNLYRGSGLGLAHGLNQVGGFRPRNKDEEFSNVYYVGASTTPGTGLPMVVIGSRLVSERIAKDFGTLSPAEQKKASLVSSLNSNTE